MSSQRSRLAWGATVALAGALLVAWWWPGLSGRPSSADVLVSAPTSQLAARDVIDRRLREEGFTTAWQIRTSEDCNFEISSNQPFSHLVVLLPEMSSCDRMDLQRSWKDLQEVASSARVTAVRSWRDSAERPDVFSDLERRGLKVLSPHRLISDGGDSQPCLWWDDCPPSGRVVTFDNGELTEAGIQRLARTIVAGVL